MRAVCGSSSTVAGHLAGGTHHAFRGVQQINSTQPAQWDIEEKSSPCHATVKFANMSCAALETCHQKQSHHRCSRRPCHTLLIYNRWRKSKILIIVVSCKHRLRRRFLHILGHRCRSQSCSPRISWYALDWRTCKVCWWWELACKCFPSL